MTLKAPAVFHCKSGADRAGFVSALYLNMVAGHPMEEAAKQLSLRHLHVDFTPTGVLDYVLRVYMERNRRSPFRFATGLFPNMMRQPCITDFKIA